MKNNICLLLILIFTSLNAYAGVAVGATAGGAIGDTGVAATGGNTGGAISTGVSNTTTTGDDITPATTTTTEGAVANIPTAGGTIAAGTDTSAGNNNNTNGGGNVAQGGAAGGAVGNTDSTTYYCDPTTFCTQEQRDFWSVMADPLASNIDTFNRKSINSGGNGFLVNYALDSGQQDVDKLYKISHIDQFDAASSPEVVSVTLHAVPGGVDDFGFGGVQTLGEATSVYVVAPSSFNYSYEDPLQTDVNGNYLGVAIQNGMGLDETLILINSDQVGGVNQPSILDVALHESFHAGMNELTKDLAAEPNTTDETKKAAQAMINTLLTTTVNDLFLFGAMDSAYYNSNMEFLAYCSQSDTHCGNYESMYRDALVKQNFDPATVDQYVSDIENDPVLQNFMKRLNDAAALY